MGHLVAATFVGRVIDITAGRLMSLFSLGILAMIKSGFAWHTCMFDTQKYH